MWAAVLPIDIAKTRIQTVVPGSPDDVSLVAHLMRIVRSSKRPYQPGGHRHATCESCCGDMKKDLPRFKDEAK